jgi:hypothetical protein
MYLFQSSAFTIFMMFPTEQLEEGMPTKPIPNIPLTRSFDVLLDDGEKKKCFFLNRPTLWPY